MISSHVENSIIQNYLLGVSRDEIAEETGVAPGSVSNKVNEWKKRIGAPDVEELRRFAVSMRKSGISIKQCARGFRIFQILKALGIIIENNDIDSDLDNLTFFVNEIYTKCKENSMTPNVVISWIIDLIEFSSENYGYLYENSKNIMQISSNGITANAKKTIPFVSVISDFIEIKKKEVEDLQKSKNMTIKEISRYEIQKKELMQKIQNLKQENESIIEFHETFIKLCDTLIEECNIDLKRDPRPFIKLMLEFKENNYDMIAIVDEYNKVTNLKWEIIQEEARMQACVNELTVLERDIEEYKSFLSTHKQNWDTYQQLKDMKFGLDELKQLQLTVSEISKKRGTLNPFETENPVADFIKDIEENYYDKIRFEDRVKEKRKELLMLQDQLNASRWSLFLHPFLGSTLFSLYQKGISEQDIIEINQLFEANILHNDAPNDSTGQGKNKIKIQDQSDPSYNSKRDWKVLKEELKKFKDIKTAVMEESVLLDKTRKEYTNLIEKVQNLSFLCQNAITLINALNNQYYYYRGLFNHQSGKIRHDMENNSIPLPVVILFYYVYIKDRERNEE